MKLRLSSDFFDGEKIYILPEDWEDRAQLDPIQNFVNRVNDRATSDPLWPTDFRRATYNAFHKEAQINIMTALRVNEGPGDVKG